MKYFTLQELTKTNTGLKNNPNNEQILNLTFLIDNLLDKAREEFKSPIIVTSGFRSEAVNKRIGGVKNSQHLYGEAVDLICKDNARLFAIISKMVFDQLIWEKGNKYQPAWIHLSLKRKGVNRQQIIRL